MLAQDIIQRVREIQVRTGRQVADVLAGEYVSVFKGRGIEFDEVRPYVPGDDVRTIDWNVTARTGEPYVKRYVEERQLTLMLMADVSASQDFGSRHALEARGGGRAVRAAGVLGHPQRRQGRADALPRRDRAVHPAAQGPEARAARGARGARPRPRLRRPKARPRGAHRWLPRFSSWRRPRGPREATDIGRAMEFLLSVHASARRSASW